MDVEEDPFEIKTKSAKKGRRAARHRDIDSTIPADEGEAALDSSGPMKPKKVMGGWGEDNIRTPPASGRRRTTQEEEPGTQFTKFDEDGDSDPDIPVIPDLEDGGGGDDSSTQIAIAPSVLVNKVASYRDLDNDLQRTQFAMVDKDIDLKLLTKYLATEVDCKQDSRPWVWEHIFTEISSELTSEWTETDAETQSEAMQL